jgi:hypothetical protein
MLQADSGAFLPFGQKSHFLQPLYVLAQTAIAHWYFCQCHQGLLAVPDKVLYNPKIVKLFNRSLTVRENINIYFHLFYFNILIATYLKITSA